MADRDPLTAVRAVIRARLADRLGEGWSIASCAWPMTVDEFRAHLRQTPVALVAFTRFRAAGGGRTLDGVAEFAVLIAVTGGAAAEDRWTGSRRQPGLDRALMTAAVALHGETVPDLGTLQVGDITPVYSDSYGEATLGLGLVPVACRVIVGDVLGWAGGLDDFAALTTTWETAPDEPADTITPTIAPGDG